MSKNKSKENPFSFFAYDKKKGDDIFGDSDDEDIFSDTSLSKTRSTTTKAPAPPTSKAASKTTDPENPFSFFKHTKEDVDMPPPPPKQPNKSTDTLFDSTDEEEDDDDWGTPVTKNIDTPPLPGAAFHNKSVSSPGRANNTTSTSDASLEKYKRKSEQAEAMILGYEEKLKQANKKIAELKEKEKNEMEEMESALRMITRKFEETQKRAEKAEAENAKLRKLLNQQNNTAAQYGPDWQAMNEKTNYAVETMKKIALQSEQSINGLLTVKNDFQLLIDMLNSMDKISVVHSNNNSQ